MAKGNGLITPILNSLNLSKQRIGSSISTSYKNLRDVAKDQSGLPGKLAVTGVKKIAPGLALGAGADYLLSDSDETKKKKQSERDEKMKEVGRNEATSKFLGNKTEKELKKEEDETNKKAESIKKQLSDIENQKKQRQENLKREQEIETKKQQLLLKQKEIDKAKKEDEKQDQPVQVAKKEDDKSPTKPLPVMTGSLTSDKILKHLDDNKYKIGGAVGLAALGGLGYAAYKRLKKKKQEQRRNI